jgi:hypothetical protein
MFWVVAGLVVVVLAVGSAAFGRTRAQRAERDDPAQRAYEGGCYRNTCGRGRAPGLMNHRMGRS